MVNLEKISELLEKGIENSAIQNEEGKFSVEKWRKEVKAYTEPFLMEMKERLNQALASEKAFSQGKKFKVLRKTQGKQRRISDLQEIKCNLAEPFSIDAREDDRRPINGIVAIGPASNLSGEDYAYSLCWGLDWWGSKKKAQNAYVIFSTLNADNAMIVSQSGDDFGKTIRLFNHINGKKLKERGFESIVDTIIKDFLRLSSILSQNKRLFENFVEDNERQLKRDDVENAIRCIRSRTGKTEISKPDVLKEIETQQKKGNLHLKSDWRKIFEEKLDEWFK